MRFNWDDILDNRLVQFERGVEEICCLFRACDLERGMRLR